MGVPGPYPGHLGMYRATARLRTVETTGFDMTPVCVGSANPQIFEINGDVGIDAITASFGLNTRNCPTETTLLINVLGGPVRYVGSYSYGTLWDHNPTKIPWNVINAAECRVYGTGQSIGSYLLPVFNNTAKFRTSGINGRVNVEHGPWNGGEIHNYPFEGRLPSCGNTCPC